MALKKLINGQKIRIDDHHWGTGEALEWDNPSKDVHIEKSTNRGKNQVIIKIPINSDREIEIEKKIGNGRGESLTEIPHELQREIESALKNKSTRGSFMDDLVDVLKNFPTALSDEKRASDVLERLSKHFDLEWTGEKISQYANDALTFYVQMYRGENGKEYIAFINKKEIGIGENSNNEKRKKKIF
ncbi:hypothetical protein AGMMS49965_25460 [Bacteroidia bacterium]|nr:hypothetical protein AGMMS49965_25460 [Bacteroidia bacterium]